MGEQPRLQILRHGHINQYSNSMSECLGFYRDVLGANVFSEFTAPQHGAANALAVLGSACLEFFAPLGGHSTIGSWLQKHGQRWHSLEWTVPSLIEAIDVVNSRGMRITQHSAGEYIFVHPKDCYGLSIELTDRYFVDDPRDAVDFTAVPGTAGCVPGVTLTLCVEQCEAAAEWIADLVGGDVAPAYEGSAARSAAVTFVDHTVEFVSPSGDGDDVLRRALAERGNAIFAVTIPVASLGDARSTLSAREVPYVETVSNGAEMLSLDPQRSGGGLLRLRQG